MSLGEKYEKGKEKRGKMQKETEKRGKGEQREKEK
jgi:hypothetical protein